MSPQFLLEKFGNKDSGDIYVFDKQTGKSFAPGPSRLAVDRDLYDFEFKDCSDCIGAKPFRIESEAADCVDKILQRARLAIDKPEVRIERSTLIRCLCVQLVRTRTVCWGQVNCLVVA
jgi:hypothetical protein